MNRIGRGDSAKRGVGRLSGQQDDASEQETTAQQVIRGYNILYCNVYIYINNFIYYITIKFALPVSCL